MFLFINYPNWIHPQIFPNIPILGLLRWYGLMYILAFGIAFFLLKQMLKEGTLGKATEDDLTSFLSTGILFLLLGARIFSVLVYDTTDSSIHRNPLLIFWPYNAQGKFTGLAGMSYHGGFIGGLLGVILWCVFCHKSFLRYSDAIATAIPLGYTFGRVGNFMNGELFGRITTVPWGIVFPRAAKFSLSIQWVHDFAQKAGMQVGTSGIVNLPRHPSQLYEAFFEGIVLWLILWIIRKHRPFLGFSTALYTLCYAIFRFIIEYFREPDLDLGFRIAQDKTAPIYTNTSLLNLSTGQVLCLCMIVVALIYGTVCYILHKKAIIKDD